MWGWDPCGRPGVEWRLLCKGGSKVDVGWGPLRSPWGGVGSLMEDTVALGSGGGYFALGVGHSRPGVGWWLLCLGVGEGWF